MSRACACSTAFSAQRSVVYIWPSPDRMLAYASVRRLELWCDDDDESFRITYWRGMETLQEMAGRSGKQRHSLSGKRVVFFSVCLCVLWMFEFMFCFFFCFLGFSRFKMQSFCSNALGLIHRGHSFESLVTTTTTADFDLRPLPASTGDRYRLRVIAPNTIDLLITISDRSSISGGLTHLHRRIEPRCSAKVRSESHSFCRFLPWNAG